MYLLRSNRNKLTDKNGKRTYKNLKWNIEYTNKSQQKDNFYFRIKVKIQTPLSFPKTELLTNAVSKVRQLRFNHNFSPHI